MRKYLLLSFFSFLLLMLGCVNMAGFGTRTDEQPDEQEVVNSKTRGIADSIAYTVRQNNQFNNTPAPLQLNVETPVLFGKSRFYKIDGDYLIGCLGKHGLRIYILRHSEQVSDRYFEIMDSASQSSLELPLPPPITPGELIRLRGECRQQ